MISYKTKYKNDYLSRPLHHHIRSNTNRDEMKENKKLVNEHIFTILTLWTHYVYLDNVPDKWEVSGQKPYKAGYIQEIN